MGVAARGGAVEGRGGGEEQREARAEEGRRKEGASDKVREVGGIETGAGGERGTGP